MKRFIFVAAAVLLPATVTMASALHNHTAAGPAPVVTAKTVDTPDSPMAATGMVQANMAKMQEQMKSIRQTKDPEEKARLMQQHMQAIQVQMQAMQSHMKDTQGHMSMMHGTMGKGMQGKGMQGKGMQGNGMMGNGMKKTDAGATGPMHAQMMTHMTMMSDQMNMMQGLMEQMRDHQDVPMSANKK